MAKGKERSAFQKNPVGFTVLHVTLVILIVVWTLPTLGVFVTSFRARDEVSRTGWWMAFTTPTKFTLDNYRQVLSGKNITVVEDGVEKEVKTDNLSGAFLNSLGVTIPSVVIPILIAAFAAYGFAWLAFPGRKIFFILVVGVLVVPLQIALIPVLKDYQQIGMNGTLLGIWLFHAGFGMPLATYLLFNYISTIPRSIIESALIDGADHFTIFIRLILPLSLPALASFAIFQFIWVWNDLLVAMVILGSGKEVQVITQKLYEIIGSRGQDWHLLTAGAFVSMILPLTIFFALQRFFVRGMMAGSVKG